MGKLLKKEMIYLFQVNKRLLVKTGVDFLKKLTDLANNEKKTELDCHEFIKKNYPFKTLTKIDHQNISLLIRFYQQKVDEHETEAADTCYCECRPVENVYDKPWRSRFLRKFIGREPTLVTGFFPKD